MTSVVRENLLSPGGGGGAGITIHLAALKIKSCILLSVKSYITDSVNNAKRTEGGISGESKRRRKSDGDVADCRRGAAMCAAEIRTNQSRAPSNSLNPLKCHS